MKLPCSNRRVPPLLLAALLLGGSAHADVTPVAPAPATPIEPAPSSVAAPARLTALQGRWQPVSKALQGAGPLTLTARTLTWSPCGPVARAVYVETAGNAVLLSLPGQAACRLDGRAVAQLRLQQRAGNACEMELSVYPGTAQRAKRQRLAWGVYTRQGCTPG